jgi:Cu/Ag efflux protein CusF
MTYGKLSVRVALALLLAASLKTAAAQDVVHAVSGEVTKVDKSAKTLTVKAEDGTEHAFKYSDKTTVRGYHDASKMAKAGAMDTYFDGKEGTHVVVRYTKKGADKAALSVEDFGKEDLKEARGTVTKVDKGAHTVTVKTEEGAEATYSLGRDAAVDTEKGVVKGTDYTAKEGDKVVVHYSEDAGKKVVHFFKSL